MNVVSSSKVYGKASGPSVAIVDTGVANAASVLFAFERMGVQAVLTQDPEVISTRSHVVLPGVGTALASMEKLKSKELVSCIRELKQPVLGICLGMQLFFQESEEGSRGGNVSCLGVIPGTVRRMKVSLPVPHMGWNQVRQTRPSQLLKGIQEKSYFYFVHSFFVPQESSEVKAVADYEISIPAIVEAGNWLGTQFHPERSGEVGQALLRNFVQL